jgi:hypothetical protein
VLHRFASTKKFNEISVTRVKREIFGVWLRVPNDSKSRIRSALNPIQVGNRAGRDRARLRWQALSRQATPDRLEASAFDGVLDLAEWNGGSAIVHARSRYRALAALDLGKLAHQLPPAAVQIVLDRFALPTPLPFIALYKDTVDHCVVLATQRDRQ